MDSEVMHHEIVALLDSANRRLPDEPLGPAPDDLLDWARRSAVTDLLAAVESDPDQLSAVARASYRHVLGFDKIVLASAGGAGRLRLHVWWPSAGRDAEHSHNHRYGSHSVVIAGALRTHVHTVNGSG